LRISPLPPSTPKRIGSPCRSGRMASAFDAIKSPESKADAIIPLRHGEPIRFGVDGGKGLIRNGATGGVKVADVGEATGQAREGDLLIHDAHSPDPTVAFAISRLTDAGYLRTSPIGIFRQVERPTYDDQARAQLHTAGAAATGDPAARLAALINGGDTWTVV